MKEEKSLEEKIEYRANEIDIVCKRSIREINDAFKNAKKICNTMQEAMDKLHLIKQEAMEIRRIVWKEVKKNGAASTRATKR